MAVTADEQVLARIGFAERWLDRARRQWAQGNVARGGLTLVLAAAEVHHALAAAGVPGTRSAARRPRTVAVLLAGVLVTAVLIVARWPAPSSVVSTPGPAVVRLASSSGSLLDTRIPFPETPAFPAMAAPVPAPITLRAVTEASDGRGTAALRQREVAPVLRTAGAPDRVVVNTGSTHIVVSELIDLVLTADRVLRREPTAP